MLHAYIGHDLSKQYRATKCTISLKKVLLEALKEGSACIGLQRRSSSLVSTLERRSST